MRVYKIAGILLAAWMATVANATTLQPIGYDNNFGMQVTLNVNGVEHDVWAGPFQALLDNATTVEVFCLDFFTSIDYQPYMVTATPPSPSLYQAAAQMYSTFIGNMTNATGAARNLYGAALQIALWEVTIDGFPSSSTGLATGNFRESTVTPLSANLETVVSSYLSATLGPVAPGTVIYQSANKDIAMQPLIGGGGNVPEPGTWAMLGTGLLCLGLVRRRA